MAKSTLKKLILSHHLEGINDTYSWIVFCKFWKQPTLSGDKVSSSICLLMNNGKVPRYLAIIHKLSRTFGRCWLWLTLPLWLLPSSRKLKHSDISLNLIRKSRGGWAQFESFDLAKALNPHLKYVDIKVHRLDVVWLIMHRGFLLTLRLGRIFIYLLFFKKLKLCSKSFHLPWSHV